MDQSLDDKIACQSVTFVFNTSQQLRMINKNPSRAHDPYAGQWNVLGGKMPPHLHPIAAATMELNQEDGIVVRYKNIIPHGVVCVDNKNGEKYVHLHIFSLWNYEGPTTPSCAEGVKEWVEIPEAYRRFVEPHDRRILELVLKRQTFYGCAKRRPEGPFSIEPHGFC